METKEDVCVNEITNQSRWGLITDIIEKNAERGLHLGDSLEYYNGLNVDIDFWFKDNTGKFILCEEEFEGRKAEYFRHYRTKELIPIGRISQFIKRTFAKGNEMDSFAYFYYEIVRATYKNKMSRFAYYNPSEKEDEVEK